MTTIELEQVILDYIRDFYKKEYVGKINITKLEPIGYYIKIGMGTPYQPVVIYAELDDDQFLKFIKQELKHRLVNNVHYGEVKLIEPYNPKTTLC